MCRTWKIFAENPCPKAHLVEVACDQFAGFVWINMDSDCVPLRDFMGELWEGRASYPLEDMTRTQAISVRLPCKWKMIMDNFHEVYHLAVSHPDAILFADDDYRQVRLDLYENGHALGANFGAYPAKRILESGIDRMTDILVNELRQWGLDPEDFRGREDEARGAIQQAKRVEGPRRGLRHYDALSDAQLTDTFHYTVFPNFATSLNPDGMLFLRALPDAKDPEKCVFDCWYYAYGDGKGQNAFGALVTAGEGAAGVEREWVEYGEKSLGVVLDGDVDVMAGQQKAMHSAGYRGSLHAGQEKRVAQYHNMIDAYIAGYRPAPRAARDRRSASASP
jgi:phenylpropionate dioxygenase-like ring-hydroxylating dioxygenase large terminal subunit